MCKWLCSHWERGSGSFSEADLREVMANVIFLVSDAPSVNTGLKYGLIKLFKDESPWVGFVWCISYRLEFARELSLQTQKHEQNLIFVADQIEVTNKRYNSCKYVIH